MGGASYQGIFDQLYSAYKDNGYISTDTVFETIISLDLPLYDIDRICDQLLSRGVIIRDDPKAYTDEEEGEYDRSQIDFEQLYEEILAIDPGLEPFISEVRQIQPPQHREWQTLIPQAKSGNQYAYQRLSEMYTRTVIKLALAIHKKYNAPLADTIQEGYIGLMTALDKYEIGRQDVFPTYYPLWVRQNIQREMPFSLNPVVYFPVHIKEKLYSIYDRVLDHECNECSGTELCSTLIVEVAEALSCSIEDAKRYLRYFEPIDSLERIIKEDPQILSDHGSFFEDYYEVHTLYELHNVMSDVLQALTFKEQQVLKLRFGFVDDQARTLEEVGIMFGVTRERIRQIEAKAIRKLSHPTREKKLRPFE